MGHLRSTRRRALAWAVAWAGVVHAFWSGAIREGRAQDAWARRWEWQTWRQEQGLPDNAVECVYRSRRGWLWVGTRRGLARFDGMRFTRYTGAERGFTDDAVISLGEDGSGAVWAGTKRQVFGLGAGGFAVPEDQPVLAETSVRAMTSGSGGALWLASTHGVHRLRDGVWMHRDFAPTEAVLPEGGVPPQVFALAEDGQGTLWVGSDAGLYRWDSPTESWIRDWWKPAPPKGDSSQDHIVRVVGSADHGVLWFSTDAELVRRGPGRRYDTFPIPPGVGDARVRRVYPTAGGPWVVAGGRLLRVVAGRWVAVAFWPGQDDAFVTDVVVDDDGPSWLTTRYGGLVRLRRPLVTCFTTRDGLPHNTVHSVCATATGGLWVATGGGLASWRGDRFQGETVSGFAPRQAWQAVLEDRHGDLWLGANPQGMRWLTHPTNNPSTEPTPGARWVPGYLERRADDPDAFPIRGAVARVFHEDRDGRLWLGQRHSLFVACPGEAWVRIHPGERLAGRVVRSRRPYRWFLGEGDRCETDWATYFADRDPVVQNWISPAPAPFPGGHRLIDPPTTRPLPSGFRLPNPDVRCILHDRAGRFWFGTLGGLIRVERGDVRVITRADGLAGDAIEALSEDETGAIWAGTRTGLSRLGIDGWRTFGPSCGLMESEFAQIIGDLDGALWFGGQRGLTRVLREELEAVALGRAERVTTWSLGESEGLLAGETLGGSQPSVARTPDGRLWFATGQGLAMVNPADFRRAPAEPIPCVEAVVVSGRRTDLPGPGGDPAPNGPIVLEPGSGRSLEIHYTGLHERAPEGLEFEYALLGHGEKSVQAGSRRVAYFTNLRPGTYRFRVRAFLPGAATGERWAEATFRIRPHLWETSWLRVAVGAGLGLAIGGLIRWRWGELRRFARIENENRVREERERIARDLHDDVASTLTLITMLDAEPSGSPRSDAGRRSAASLADAALDSLAELVWATNPRFDTLDSLAAYLRELSRRLLEDSTVRLHHRFPAKVAPVPVSGEFRRHVVLIVKEALHNVRRHAAANEVVVELRIEAARDAPWLVVSVEDDGRGLRSGEESPGGVSGHGGNGLRNLRQRAAQLGGSLTIESRAGTGTRLTVRAPLSLSDT